MVDLKKFVAYFLVLASIASSFAFVLSGVLSAPAPNAGSQTASTPEKTAPPVSQNAFVEKIPDSSPKVDIEPGLPPIILTDNLTENVAQGLTREFFRANMNGPVDVEGEPTVSLPSASQIDSAIVKKLASPETAVLVTLPNFNEIAAQSKFKIGSDTSPEELYAYLVSLDKTLKDTILSKDFNDLMQGDPSFEAISAVQFSHSRALYGLRELTVPSSLSALHASAFKLVSDAKKIVDIPTQDSNDPLKTLAVMKGISGKIELVLKNDFENFSAEFKKLEARRITVFPRPENTGLIGRIFVLEAHAQVGVPISTAIDVPTLSNWAANIGKWVRIIWEWAQKAILQALIHALIQAVQQQVVNWINGNGDPQFVMDWKDLVGLTFDAASNSTINRIAGILCTGLNVNIQAAFLPSPPYTLRFQCTINDIIRNLSTGFNVSFSAGGGFESFGQLLQQNFFIVSMETSDETLNHAIASVNARKNEAVVGAGFFSTKKCGDGSVVDRKTGMCPDGTPPIITTPGETISASISHTLNLGPDSIVNANDITGLVNAIISASVNRLIGAGLNGLLSLTAETSYPEQRNYETPPSGPEDIVIDIPDPVPAEQDPEIDLTSASAYQDSTRSEETGGFVVSGPADFATDYSNTSFSETSRGGTDPSYWYVQLPPPEYAEYIDEVQFATASHEGRSYPLIGWGGGGPNLLLTEQDPPGSCASAGSDCRPDGTWHRVPFASSEGRGIRIPAEFQRIEVAYVGFEAAHPIRLADVRIFRHLSPTINITNVPSSLTSAAARAGFDPLQSAWVSAQYFPFHRDAGVAAAISFVIRNSAGIVCTSAPCTLADGTYRFEYTATDPGVPVSTTRSKPVRVGAGGGAVPPPGGGVPPPGGGIPPPGGGGSATLSVTKTGTGAGTVTGAGAPAGTNISCGTNCDETYATSPTITLTATPGAGSTFAGWSGGGCSGMGACVVSMTLNIAITATFNSVGGGATLECFPARRVLSWYGSTFIVDMEARRGTGPYNWSNPGGTPSSLTGRVDPKVRIGYPAPRATYTATVTDTSSRLSRPCTIVIE